MAEITCSLEQILNPSVCNDRGGIRAAYWFECDKVDWDTMIADPLQFDTTGHIVLGYTMIGGAVMNKLTFERKNAFYDFTYTSDTDVYVQLITMFFKAKDADRRLKLQQAIACCDIGFHIYANDGTQRVVCMDYNGEVIEQQLEPLRLTRHLDSGGQLGTSKARDEVDLGGESFFAPMFANVPEASLPLT
jgi:hypothetical protein